MQSPFLRAAAALLLAMALACRGGASLEAPRSAGPSPAPPLDSFTAIRLEHAADRDAWQLAFTLPHPTSKVRFVRSNYPNRIAHWRVTTPGLRLSREHEEDVIQSDDGRSFAGFAMDIASYAIHPEKDYQVFVPYGDGSTLVYTGQFDIGVPGENASAVKTTFTFVPRKSERVVVKGEVSSGPRTWMSRGDGTYVYFGSTKPVIGNGFVALVDAAMPTWLRGSMETLLPQVFALYATRLGLPLSFRPTVFMSYGEEPAPKDFSVDGGTLPEVIQMEVRLGTDHRILVDEHVRGEVGRLVAHEVAHLWNGQMFHHTTRGGDWMHEGGADAFAYEALGTLGAMSRDHLRAEEGDAFSRCLVGTRLGPLHGASMPGRFKLYYWCGHLVAHLTKDIFAFWGTLLRAAPAATYDEEQYLRLLGASPGGAMAETAVRGLLAGAGPDPVPALLAADRSLVPTPKTKAFSMEYEQFSGLVAATLVLRSACGRDVTPRSGPGGLRVDGTCGELGKDPILAELADRDLRRAGAAAYDAAVATCAERPTVTAGIRRDTDAQSPIVRLELACPRPFPARPPHVTPR